MPWMIAARGRGASIAQPLRRANIAEPRLRAVAPTADQITLRAMSMIPTAFWLALVTTAPLVPRSLAAQAMRPGASDSVPAAPRIRFTRALELDGALDDAAWATADSIGDFMQRDPKEGVPGSERTVVRFLGTTAGMWVGIWASDRDPSGIRRTQLRRDADMSADDNVTLMFSPTSDKRTAFLFTVNPNGALQDAEVQSFESESREWDGIWDARARTTPNGWQAEVFIPWQTLRYRPVTADAAADAWDVNIRRFIRRKNETILWRGWKRTEGIRFLERAGTLHGFRDASVLSAGGLPRRAIAEVRPYAISTGRIAERSYQADGSALVTRRASVINDIGIDAKLAPAPTLTLDLTANADFAQAEVDRQVVNLSRFPLFFPEQRPFFTEGAGIFAFGRQSQSQLFYSRRIGLAANGTPLPVLGGARLTGRLGDQQIGFLATRTGGDDPETQVVARVKRDVLGRGYVGAMGTLRAPDGVASAGAGGVDINLPYVIRDQNLVFLGNVAMDGGKTAGDPVYARAVIDFPNDVADIAVRFDRIGEGFRPDLGFVQQRGITRLGWQTEFTPRPTALGVLGRPLTALGVRRLKFEPLRGELVRTMGSSSALAGLTNGSLRSTPFGVEFDSGDEVSVELSRHYDAPPDAFDLVDDVFVQPGRYHWDRGEVQFKSSSARTLSLELTAGTGGFYTGRSTELAVSLRGRFAPHVNVTADWGRSAVSLPSDSATARFTAQSARIRLDVAANPRLNTTLFAQWDNESHRAALNARVRWTTSPGSDAYLVYNSIWPSDLGRGIPWSKPTRGTVVVKYVRYFRV